MMLPDVLLQVSVLLAVAVVAGVGARRIGVPVTVVLAVTGFAANAVLGPLDAVQGLRGEGFHEVLLFVFLPALVFAAVLDLPVRSFLRNLVPILALATVAFGLSALLVGLAVAGALGVPTAAALVFGALISATDPVAVVAVFKDLGVPQRLLTLVEGESLLNDGVAIVLFEVLLATALGQAAGAASTAWSFITVFAGGGAVGLVVGLIAAMALPWMDRLAAGTLSVAVAYGSFVLADHVLGFSGVIATAAAGFVFAGLAPSRASADVRELCEQLWASLDHIANAVLFLLIGLVIEPRALLEYAVPILLAIAAVLVARPLGVAPIVLGLERLTGIPRVGGRNEVVLMWGGLRGGVALALALALPEDLAQRELFVAMTAGVVLATLLLNATTIGWLVRRLGLDQPDATDRFLTAWAELRGAAAARRQLEHLGIEDPMVSEELDRIERSATGAIEELELDAVQQERLLLAQGLHAERETYQRLSDSGLLPPPVARTLLHEVDEQVEELTARRPERAVLRRRERSPLARLGQWVATALPSPPGEPEEALAYAEASARRLAARRTEEALDSFDDLPCIGPEVLERAKVVFSRWEGEAIDELDAFDEDDRGPALRHRQAEALGRATAEEELRRLVTLGVLPATVAERAGVAVDRALEG